MDEVTVRAQLGSLREELARNDDERAVLVALVKSYEAWLRIHGKDTASQMPLPIATPKARPAEPKRSGVPKGSTSMRGAVVRVLRDAHGEPLHAKEILARAQALGAASDAKNPLSVVALMVRQPIAKGQAEKVGPRTWRWIGEGTAIE